MTGHGPRHPVDKSLLAGVAYIVFILLATLLPGPPRTETISSICLFCGSRGLSDLVLNIFFFLPLGFFLCRPLGWRKALLTGVALSATVEVLQLWIPGRYTTLSDFLCNSAGTGLGVALARSRWTAIWRPPPRLGRMLTGSWTAAVVLGLTGAAILFQPSIPRRPLYGQWTHDLGQFEVYDGRVLAMRIGGIPAPDGLLKESGPIRDSLQRGTAMRLRFIAGPPPAGLAPIFSIFDDRQEGAFLIGVDGTDLVMTLRRKADDVRLDRPELRWRDALSRIAVGDTVEVDASHRSDGAYDIAVRRGARALAAGKGGGDTLVERGIRGYRLARSWALLLFSGSWPSWWVASLDLLWLAALGLPMGWWSPDWTTLGATGSAYLLALALIPMTGSVQATTLAGFLAASGGVAAGAWLSSVIPSFP